MRELLEEAQDRLVQNTPHRPGTCVECDNNRSTIAKITSALADPEPDAMEMVRKIRYPKYTQIDAITSSMTWFTDDQAAALIESYGRRVPRAMLEELRKYWRTCAMLRQEPDPKEENAITAKHGVKLEDEE